MEDRLIIGYTSGNYIDSACLTVIKEIIIINEGVGPNIVKSEVINTVYGYLARNLYRILTEPDFLKDSIHQPEMLMLPSYGELEGGDPYNVKTI